MPTPEQMLYAQLVLIEGQLDYLSDNLEHTDFAYYEDTLQMLHKGLGIVRRRFADILRGVEESA